MPKKTRYKKAPEFYETLTPSLPLGASMPNISAIPSSPLWIYPAWVAGSVILGILFGLAIKDFQTPTEVAARAGIVAKINDPQSIVVTSGMKVAQTQNQIIQGNASLLQGVSTVLQPGQTIASYQNGFSGYGQQGSVGTSAAMQ